MSTYTCRLQRSDPGISWGFRLQGGTDFNTPLCMQKVNEGSIAASAGIQPGDAILRIGHQDVTNFTHKDAQDVIMRSGNSLEMALKRC